MSDLFRISGRNFNSCFFLGKFFRVFYPLFEENAHRIFQSVLIEYVSGLVMPAVSVCTLPDI